LDAKGGSLVRNEHWKAVPWLVGLVLVIDIVGRGHADLGELIGFGAGTFVISAACIAVYDALDRVRVGGRRRF